MQVGKKVYYQGKNWTVACFFPDTMGLIPMKPYDTWLECFKEVGLTYEIKVQLLYKHDTYSQYQSVNAYKLFENQICKYLHSPSEEPEWKKIYKEITKEPLWKEEDLVPNPL